ncbi:restriction endonuclease [Candidatus Bipolaricaulota bacterium]|nr:restriction endonuclease [Candidatus Bipolaricaulota bacterium]
MLGSTSSRIRTTSASSLQSSRSKSRALRAASEIPLPPRCNGKVDNGEFGLLVTLGTFTPAAKSFARGKSNLRLIDGGELVDLIFEYYEQFDSKYKGLLPLKHVYVPEPIGGGES